MKILVLYLFEALMLFVLTIFFSEINKNVLEAQSKLKESFNKNKHKYQPSGAGGTRSPPATPHRLPGGPKMAEGVWKGVQS